ncbi:hypothetical protein SAMN04489740_2526 [Arthrobacter alpinus]|uniref:Uncharacterized protein n=1 Tax=Arthrobacter alpinus TaxID=656366 RepID=A0A1H5LMU3_9MICC|nr:hypothetical protein [Arthrobacter alpinus]SEE78375.1 hypothetical protein SAMN04489740_2526 [Arthrobacter alpinus]
MGSLIKTVKTAVQQHHISSATRQLARITQISHPSGAPAGGPRVFTPAMIAAWAAGLEDRAELCLGVNGTDSFKLTLYVCPSDAGAKVTAIITGPGLGCYISAHHGGSTEAWVASLIHDANYLNDEKDYPDPSGCRA